MNNARLHALRSDAFLWLQRNVSENLDAYADPHADFGRILEENGYNDYKISVNVTINGSLDLKDPTTFKKAHLSDEQALEFYQTLEGMTPRLAADPRVLAYMNHFYLHGYGINRWPTKITTDHVHLHWLTQGEPIYQYSISGRTWWVAHTAIKAAKASGGAFTVEQALNLFSQRPEYYHRTMQYAVLRNPLLLAECVRALMHEAHGITRDGYREICMDLNRAAGAKLLDSLDRESVRAMVKSSADRLKRDPKFVTNRRDMVGVKKFTVLSLGAGAQSTVLALMAERGFGGLKKPDLAIFADTQWEPPTVYEHLEWLKKQLSYEVATVSAGNIKDNIMRGTNSDGAKFLDVPVFLINNDGSKAVAARQCTNHYKIIPIHREIRRRLEIPSGRRFPKNIQVEMWLGISADESHRMKPSRDEWIDKRFPLVEQNMTRANIYNWFNERYPDRRLPRSACVGCPYHDNMEWKWLKENEPKSFEGAVQVDRALRSEPKVRGSLRGEAYLHKSRKPLDTVDFSETQDYDDYMASECEGLCGV